MLADAMSVAVGPCHCCIALERSSGDPAAPVLGRSDMVPPNGLNTLLWRVAVNLFQLPQLRSQRVTVLGSSPSVHGTYTHEDVRKGRAADHKTAALNVSTGTRKRITMASHSIPKKWCSGLIGSAGRVWAAGREAGRVYEAASCSIHTYTGVGTEQPYLREQKLYHILAPAAPDSPQTQSQFRRMWPETESPTRNNRKNNRKSQVPRSVHVLGGGLRIKFQTRATGRPPKSRTPPVMFCSRRSL